MTFHSLAVSRTTPSLAAAVAMLMAALSCTDFGPDSKQLPDTPPEPTIAPIARGQIVFGGFDDDFIAAIFIADSNGVRLNRLSPSGSWDINPAVSPDGKKIAFYRLEPNKCCYHIFIMNADGTGRVPLTQGTDGLNADPTWSPDGKRIAFSRLITHFNVDGHIIDRTDAIHVMNADGTAVTQLTDSSSNSSSPEWSPTGSKILFDRYLAGADSSGIFEMDADGSNPRQLTSGYRDARPRWSPDGTRIAFIRELPEGWNLFVMNADGSSAEALASGISASPAWSPDGRFIAFGMVTTARMCGSEFSDDVSPCGSEVRRVGLDGVIDPAWRLLSAYSLAWQR